MTAKTVPVGLALAAAMFFSSSGATAQPATSHAPASTHPTAAGQAVASAQPTAPGHAAASAQPTAPGHAAASAQPAPAAAQARTFVTRAGASRATFLSDAPLETMNGVSSQVGGDLTFDPSDLSTARGTIEVPVASLRTGIDLRDEHLRTETWLDAAHYPTIKFEILGVTGATRLEPNRVATVNVRGRLTLHGRSHEMTVRAQVKLMPLTPEMRAQSGNIDGDVLRVRVSFPVKLEDYGISIPTVVQLKVAAEMTVDVNLTAVARPAT